MKCRDIVDDLKWKQTVLIYSLFDLRTGRVKEKLINITVQRRKCVAGTCYRWKFSNPNSKLSIFIMRKLANIVSGSVLY